MRTSYSRRELYALGEPLGDSATYLKADGGYILGDGGGGGGSQPSNTTSTSTQTAELPEWARGYAKDTLAKGAALTDINQNPYQTYNQPRIAGFTPMQQAAQQGAANMGVSGQLKTGTNLAAASGQGGLGLAASANPENFQSQVGGYMNPYMKNVLDPQMAEMRRQYGISGTQQAGAATQAGAFGGSRDAIMAAENQRNLGTAQNQAIGQAYGNAFNSAQNQYNQGQNQALQGMQLAGQNAATLGQLGQQDYAQRMGINQLQNQYGTQQQEQTQKGLTQAYSDFQNQQNYPYKQLGFMSDMIRGMPLGQQSTSAMYQPPPSAIQTLGSAGLAAYGAKQIFGADGGLMSAYAGGGDVQSMAGGGLGGAIPGGSVMSREFKENAVGNIPTDQGLQAAAQGAQARGDLETQLAAQNEMSEDAAIRRGVSGQVPAQFANNMTRHANGGIVAFALGGTPNKSELIKQSLEDQPEQSTKDYLKNVGERNEGLSSLYGPDITVPFSKELAETREQYKSGPLSDFDKGLIALQMSGAAVDPAARGNPFAALGLIAKVGGQAGAQLAAENKRANRELLKSQAEMATSQQNRNEGRTRLAAEQEDKAQTRKAAAFEQKRDAASKAAEILSAEERNKATVGAQMASINKPGESERKIADYEARIGRKLTADEYLDVMGQVGAATYGVRHTGQKGEFEHKAKVDELIQKDKRFENISLDLMRAGGKKDAKSTALRDDANNRLSELRTEYETRYKMNAPAAGAGAPTGGTKIPNPQAIEALRGNPALRDQFDRYYGPGSSAKYLGG
jgi:hypothetical protein